MKMLDTERLTLRELSLADAAFILKLLNEPSFISSMSTPAPAATPEPSNFDPAAVAHYFDEYGVREWEHLVQTPVDKVSLHIHAH